MNGKILVNKIASRVLPRVGEILFVAIFAAVIGLGPRLMNVDGDLGRHIALGGDILDTGHVPTTDIFSFTKYGDSLTPHEWLSDVIFATAYRTAGLSGVVWVTALVLAFSYWLVYKHSLQLSNLSVVALVGSLLCAAAGSIHWLTRPHVFTILLTAIWTMELDRFRLGLRRNWLIFPLIMLLWVNLHGAFLSGFVIWLAFAAGSLLDRDRREGLLAEMLLVGPASFLVTLLNPAGFDVWKTGFGFLGNHYLVSHTAEYLPPDFQSPAFWPFLGVVIISVIILGLSRVRLNSAYLFLTAGWTSLALYSARNIPLYLVVVIPILCGQTASAIFGSQRTKFMTKLIGFQEKFARTEDEIKGGLLGLGVVLTTLILLVSGWNLDFQQQGNRFSPNIFPVEAVDWMEEQPPSGHGFNYFPWGGYLLFRLWPENLVFIDGQTDFYGEDLTREYEAVITLQPGFSAILDKYQIDWILMPVDSQLSSFLESEPGWTLIYLDETAAIVQRTSAAQ